MSLPPLAPLPGPRVLYKKACDQAAAAIVQLTAADGATASPAASDGSGKSRCRLFAVDFPPTREEQRSGTLVARYEHNYNLMESLLGGLGSNGNFRHVGGRVRICDNVNPQGGGEYLTDDEVMTGITADDCGALGRVIVLINAGVDASTLKQVRKLDDDASVIVLLNCALERLTFFDKLGMGGYFDQFKVAYYLKFIAGTGMLMKTGSEPWKLFAANGSDQQTGITPELVREWDAKPSTVDAESALRSYTSQSKSNRQPR